MTLIWNILSCLLAMTLVAFAGMVVVVGSRPRRFAFVTVLIAIAMFITKPILPAGLPGIAIAFGIAMVLFALGIFLGAMARAAAAEAESVVVIQGRCGGG